MRFVTLRRDAIFFLLFQPLVGFGILLMLTERWRLWGVVLLFSSATILLCAAVVGFWICNWRLPRLRQQAQEAEIRRLQRELAELKAR